MRRVAKVDENQAAVIEAMRRIGAYVLFTHQLKNAFDCVVVYRVKTFLVEIKNPGTLPKVYDRARLEKSLTDGERECMANVEARGMTVLRQGNKCSYELMDCLGNLSYFSVKLTIQFSPMKLFMPTTEFLMAKAHP